MPKHTAPSTNSRQHDRDRLVISRPVNMSVPVDHPVPDHQMERVRTPCRRWITGHRGAPGRRRDQRRNQPGPFLVRRRHVRPRADTLRLIVTPQRRQTPTLEMAFRVMGRDPETEAVCGPADDRARPHNLRPRRLQIVDDLINRSCGPVVVDPYQKRVRRDLRRGIPEPIRTHPNAMQTVRKPQRVQPIRQSVVVPDLTRRTNAVVASRKRPQRLNLEAVRRRAPAIVTPRLQRFD